MGTAQEKTILKHSWNKHQATITIAGQRARIRSGPGGLGGGGTLAVIRCWVVESWGGNYIGGQKTGSNCREQKKGVLLRAVGLYQPIQK